MASEQGETVRLLVISIEHEALAEVRQALGERINEVELYRVSQPVLASFRGRDLAPNGILIYDDLGEARLVTLVRRLVSASPLSGIFAVVSPGNVPLARQAVLAGAHGFFIRPFDHQQAEALLRQLGDPALLRRQSSGAPARGGHVIAFCSPKGGTGRTTLAVNTAIAIHDITGQDVVLVDADYAAPAVDVALDLHDVPDVSVLMSRLDRLDDEFLKAILAHHPSGIRALVAPHEPGAEVPKTADQVRRILEVLREISPWVVVDVGPPLDERAEAFLAGADCVVLNVIPEAISLRNAQRMLGSLWEQGISPLTTYVVLNRAGMEGGLGFDDIQQHLHVPIGFQIPDDQSLATASVNRGAPIVLDYRYSKVATAVRELAGRLIHEVTGFNPLANANKQGRQRFLVASAILGVIALVAVLALAIPRRTGPEEGGLPRLSATPSPQVVALGEPTQLAQPTPSVIPSPSPRPSPEAILPAPSRSPSPQTTAAPTLTPTPVATPSPTSTVDLSLAPQLLSPQRGATVQGDEPLVLEWQWDGELPEDGYFVLTVAYRQQGVTRYIEVPWLKSTRWEAPPEANVAPLADEGRFYWSVKVMRQTGTDGEGRPEGVPIGPMSEVRTFTWRSDP